MGTYEPCVLGSDGNCTRWSHDHAADRPSVTDNARDEEPLAWCPGCGDRIPTEVVRERGVCSNCHGTSDDPWAAGRAEMTTEQPCRHCGSCDGPPSCPDCDHADRRAETTTATTEEAAWAIHDRHCTSDDHGPHCMFWDEDYESAEALHARGLLATARTRPTREQIARALREGRTNGLCTPGVRCDLCDCAQDYEDDLALRDADAVLALLRDGAR